MKEEYLSHLDHLDPQRQTHSKSSYFFSTHGLETPPMLLLGLNTTELLVCQANSGHHTRPPSMLAKTLISHHIPHSQLTRTDKYPTTQHVLNCLFSLHVAPKILSQDARGRTLDEDERQRLSCLCKVHTETAADWHHHPSPITSEKPKAVAAARN
uniref:Uncharacterized protein n=1 Tax=Physcomitrium patens TaxID=3218 RepID=A0A2K1JEH0_PHYPA|nr:hypothetical protein PHYPA_020168 [Physcomitrium patens]